MSTKLKTKLKDFTFFQGLVLYISLCKREITKIVWMVVNMKQPWMETLIYAVLKMQY